MVKRPEKAPPLPLSPPPPPVGELPVQYKRMSASRNDPPPSNRMYLLIPMLICASLLWFAWSQWHNPPQLQPPPAKLPGQRKRVWWMPDLTKTLPPFAEGYRVERFVEKYNISACTINGNFPELNAAIFCYLYNSTLFQEANKTISQDLVENGLCSKKPLFTVNDWKLWKEHITKKVRQIAMVQHPLERFARSFRKICRIDKKCYNCGDNLSCVMRKLIKDHEQVAGGLAGHVRNYLTNHFSPQTWNCHYNRQFSTIETLKIGGNSSELSSFADKLTTILGEQKVDSETQKTIKEEIMKVSFELTAEEREIMEKVRKDEDLFRLFRYLYEHDYIIFGFTL